MIIELSPYQNHPYGYFEDDGDSEPANPYLDEAEEILQIESMDQIQATPSDWVQFAIYMPTKGGLETFSFHERQYLKTIYDSPATRKLLMAGRQVEKCSNINDLVLLQNSSLKRMGDVQIGDILCSMEGSTNIKHGSVSWVSEVLKKNSVRICTRQRHILRPAKTHPIRTWESWTTAERLQVGDRIAVVKRAGQFNDQFVLDDRIAFTAFMIGDGSTKSNFSFSCAPGIVMDEFVDIVIRVSSPPRISWRTPTTASVHPSKKGKLWEWLVEDELSEKGSYDKFVPLWVFDLSKQQTALFLNRLWSTDGHVKKNSRSKYSIEYCSVSETLIRQVQSLLWKFGVPTRIRKNWPNYWKKRGVEKTAYILRVETQDGVTTFLSEIGALGKTAGIAAPDTPSNNNRDTYPKEINNLIKEILKSRGKDGWHENRDSISLHESGLRRSLKHAPTRNKLALYIDFFRMDKRFDQELVSRLAKHLDTDLYWDRIIKIEDIGEQECVDFTVSPHSNFIANGFVTHNSTYLGNTILSYSAMNPFFRSLYVSPSNTQTKVFSRDRIKEPMEISPVLRYFSNTKLLANVLEKKLTNHSQITLRFAFLNADRCIAGSSLVQLASGELVCIRDLVGRAKFEVISSVLGEEPTTCRTMAENARSMGVREVVDLKTSCPVPLRLTLDHKVFTKRGMVETGKLVKGDFILAPRLLADLEQSWAEFKEVVPAGKEEVFDLTVPVTEAFVVNGLVVHNCRGIPADYVNIDEFQDILLENVPVIEECASHSTYKLFTYSGTPKSLDNAIEHYWSRFSTQNEWAVPCKKHGTPKKSSSWHWNILDEENVGDKSLICDKCGGAISARDPDCKWVSLNPNPRVEKPFEGYRLPQLMVPWVEWPDILDKQRKYSRTKFHNEVLGRSYDSGTRPLTRQDLVNNCNPDLSMQYYRDIIKWVQSYPVFMGVDWGCHDDQTRILTEQGFTYFKDLTPIDKVAQFNPESNAMSFVIPTAITEKDWDGEMLHFKRKSVDMMLTPDHRMLVKGVKAAKWKVESAEEFVQRGGPVEFVDRVVWEGEEKSTFILPSIPKSPGYRGSQDISMSMDFWLEFLGYYLSEGGLCWSRKKGRADRPSGIKMSQRETVNPIDAKKIGDILKKLPLNVSTFPNPKTGDLNWSIYGKQLWYWVQVHVGEHCHTKRIPREFLVLSSRQLKILFDAMMLGDGSTDARPNNCNGCYSSTSKGLCEDFQEICIKLGLRSTLRLGKPAEGNRRARWVTSWSKGRVVAKGNKGGTFTYNYPSKTRRVQYTGKVYCCTVPNGFIITERSGRIAYQGNSGENSFTVVVLGGYLPFDPEHFTYFYMKRFEGIESEPKIQLEQITRLISDFNVRYVGVDYGGGFWPNDELIREYGAEKIKKYQWVGQVKKKITFEPRLGVPRFLCHRTEIMSDIFNAIKRADTFRYPRWEEFEDPYASDFLNIHSEYNERLRMNVYKHSPGNPDDTFHATLYAFLASFFYKTRGDVILPEKTVDREQGDISPEDLDVI